MHASIRRSLFLAMGALAVCASSAFAQRGATEQPDEVTVRGERLENFRLELAAAREDLIRAYNEANSNDRNDIVCRNERPTGTRMPQRVCRSRAQTEAEAKASMNWLRSMTHSAGRATTAPVAGAAPAGPLAAVNASIGAGGAQADAEMLSAESRAAIEAELEILRRENRQVYRAMVKYLEALDRYNAARGVRAPE